jgi:hypothetical protein
VINVGRTNMVQAGEGAPHFSAFRRRAQLFGSANLSGDLKLRAKPAAAVVFIALKPLYFAALTYRDT